MVRLLILFLALPVLLYAQQQFLLKRTSSFTASASLFDDAQNVWALDEASGNAIDVKGTDDMTDMNTVTATATGIPSNLTGVRVFDGTTEYFKIEDASYSGDFTGDWSLSIWCKPSSSGASLDAAFAKYRPTGNEREFYLYYDHTTSKFEAKFSASGTSTVTTVSFGSTSTKDAWHHVVLMHDDGNDVGIIVDNGTEATASFVRTSSNLGGEVNIGAWDNGNALWHGELGQAAVWKRLLTAQEITDIYASGSGLDYP